MPAVDPHSNESTSDAPVFDADNHYYEALDAFTRHLDPSLGPRVFQWADLGGRRYPVLGGRVNRAVSNPTFDPIAPAGTLVDYFRGNPLGRPMHELMGTPSRSAPSTAIRHEPERDSGAWPPPRAPMAPRKASRTTLRSPEHRRPGSSTASRSPSASAMTRWGGRRL